MTGSGRAMVLVGAGAGLSTAIARRFAREGYDLALLARNPDKLSDLRDELTAAGRRVVTEPAQAGDEHDLRRALDDAQHALGPADVLVYNAADGRPADVTTLSPADLTSSLQVNAAGALTAVQHVLPGMRDRGRGTVLLTGGGLALYPSAAAPALSVGKAALRALAFVLHDALTPLGVHVATVTVSGTVAAGTHFDPDLIAEEYWRIHIEKADWTRELVYR